MKPKRCGGYGTGSSKHRIWEQLARGIVRSEGNIVQPSRLSRLWNVFHFTFNIFIARLLSETDTSMPLPHQHDMLRSLSP
ncbi:hypothetical protein J6590_063632 [Homalodisca vitripennis]|nr:hypothetical protein J6590_063632 [Homalodisca vitripennis]